MFRYQELYLIQVKLIKGLGEMIRSALFRVAIVLAIGAYAYDNAANSAHNAIAKVTHHGATVEHMCFAPGQPMFPGTTKSSDCK